MAADMQTRGNPLRPVIWGTAAFLLLLPAIAMQFTREVQWDAADFIAIGLLLLAACGAYELGARMSGNRAYRLAFGIAIVAGFLLVWINLAVGVIGPEDNPANALFGGVLAVGALGALMAQFRAAGMSRALFVTAFAQLGVAIYAWYVGSLEGAVLSTFFTGAWCASAVLFRTAAGEQAA